MTRRMLIATGIFYVLVGLLLTLEPASKPIHGNFLSQFVSESITHIIYGLFFIGTGLLTGGGAILYNDSRVSRAFWTVAASLRCGTMVALEVTIILESAFIPGDISASSIIVFGYLSAVMFLTISPPISPHMEQLVQRFKRTGEISS